MTNAQPAQAAEASHVSELVREEMDARGWRLDDLAGRMCGDDEKDLEEFDVHRLALDLMFTRDPRLILGEVMAAALSRAFGVSPEFFINLDNAWREWRTQQDAAQQAQALNAARWLMLCELIDRNGWMLRDPEQSIFSGSAAITPTIDAEIAKDRTDDLPAGESK